MLKQTRLRAYPPRDGRYARGLSHTAAPVGFSSGDYESQAQRCFTALTGFVPRGRIWSRHEGGQARLAADLLGDCAALTREAAATALIEVALEPLAGLERADQEAVVQHVATGHLGQV